MSLLKCCCFLFYSGDINFDGMMTSQRYMESKPAGKWGLGGDFQWKLTRSLSMHRHVDIIGA